MKVLLLSREVLVLGGAHLQTKHLLLGTEVLLKINIENDLAHLKVSLHVVILGTLLHVLRLM